MIHHFKILYIPTKINLKNKYNQNNIIKNYSSKHSQNKNAKEKKNKKQQNKTIEIFFKLNLHINMNSYEHLKLPKWHLKIVLCDFYTWSFEAYYSHYGGFKRYFHHFDGFRLFYNFVVLGVFQSYHRFWKYCSFWRFQSY